MGFVCRILDFFDRSVARILSTTKPLCPHRPLGARTIDIPRNLVFLLPDCSFSCNTLCCQLPNREGWYAATVFGFIATIAYGLITYYRYINWKTAPVAATVTVQSVPA